MGLEFYVKDKKLHTFQQSDWLDANKSTLHGACLTLSMAFVHLRREGLSPVDIFVFLRASKFRDTVLEIQKDYILGDESQELNNYLMVSASVLKDLVANRQAESHKVVLKPLGQYKSNPESPLREAKGKITERSGSGVGLARPSAPADAKRAASGSDPKAPPIRPRPNMYLELFRGMHPAAHKLIVLIFNCNGGNISHVAGAHAIVLEDLKGQAAIFDPNFGWMELRSGYNSIDVSLMLQAFKSEYDITDAHAVQDITGQFSCRF